MIVGLVKHDAGQILIGDQDITEHQCMNSRSWIRISPRSVCFRKLTVSDNLMAILEFRSDLSKNDRQKERERLLDEFHIGHLSATKGMALSGGKRRRVEIARALCSNPKLCY